MGLFAGLMVTVRIAKSEGITPQQVLDMSLLIIVSALIGSRLMYVLMNISHYLQNPLDILKIWQGGLIFSGGMIFVILVMFLYARRRQLSLLRLGDLWAPAAAVGQGIGRIGCFMAGCCYGRPTGLRWGIIFTHPDSLAPLNIALHPTQLYASLSGFIIFLILLGLNAKKEFEGQVFLWFLILHSTARLLLERFRGDNRGVLLNSSMSITQLVTVLILIAAVAALMFFRYKANK
jgi:phosphatidylglycerol:prolipoprotein diacylglycerol transferase